VGAVDSFYACQHPPDFEAVSGVQRGTIATKHQGELLEEAVSARFAHPAEWHKPGPPVSLLFKKRRIDKVWLNLFAQNQSIRQPRSSRPFCGNSQDGPDAGHFEQILEMVSIGSEG
jgi:hypothetical protein